MSLINDALKKAQRQRTGESGTDAASAEPSLRSAEGRSGSTPSLVFLAGGALLGVVLAVAAILLWPRGETPAPTSPPTAAAPAPVPETAKPSAQPAPAALPSTTPPAPSAPAVTVTIPASAPAQTTALQVSTPVIAPSRPAEPARTAVEPPPQPAGPPEPSSTFINTVHSFRVAGIRYSGTDSKVIMNDRVFRIGDTVDYGAGIRLTGVTTDSLTFVDQTGAAYTRRF